MKTVKRPQHRKLTHKQPCYSQIQPLLQVNGKTFAVKLGRDCEYRTFFVPTGCAHGFLALEDNSMMLYQTSCEFAPAHDSGIRYDSFGFKWPTNADEIIISDKDRALPEWNEKETVF